MKNNLFQYATKELSQDALLCWLANWYNYDSPLKTLSKEFVRMILSRAGITDFDINTVKVFRQYNRIDVLLIVNDNLGIIIEDKTFSSEHDNQISRYTDLLLQSPVITNTDSLQVKEVICVYYKTAEYVKDDDGIIQNNEIVKVTRGDMLTLIKPYVENSEILLDYYEYLKSQDDAYKRIEDHYKAFDYDSALPHSHMQWRFFKDFLTDEDEKGVKRFPFEGLLPEGQDPIEQGTSFGIPYTWYWFTEFSNNVPKEDLLEHGSYLGYRISADQKGTFISLRMYHRYDKENEAEKKLQQKTCLRIHDDVSLILRDLCIEDLDKELVIHFNKSGRTTNYECEIFKCYFAENVVNEESKVAFIRMLCAIRNGLQLIA